MDSVKTYFASPERTSQKDLEDEFDIVSQSPVMTGLLHSVNGLLAVVDENRQILAVNDSFLELLGLDNPRKALGMRPGEALECIHAHDAPAGCGTTQHCVTCGAVIAMVSSLCEDKPVDQICALSAQKGGKDVDLALQIRAHPIRVEGRRFLLLFIQDITLQNQRAALERTFYHDINNMLGLLVGASELLNQDGPSDLTETIHRTSQRLRQEISIQRSLSQHDSKLYTPLWHSYTLGQILDELRPVVDHHPAAQNKGVEFSGVVPETQIRTDMSLVIRVLMNMMINALEATDPGGSIRLSARETDRGIVFAVWNKAAISEDVSKRIFQRNFSTKGQDGRGLGTYSMKFFGEKILGGNVSFVTSEKGGTVFSLTLPR